MGGWAAVRRRLRRRDVANGRAALLCGGGGAGAGTVGGDEDDLRAARRKSGACLRCDSSDRFAVGSRAAGGDAPGGLVLDGKGSAARRGPCCTECHEPVTRELPGDTMTRPTTTLLWLAGAAVLATGCASAGARSVGRVPGGTGAPVAGVPADTTAAANGVGQVGAAIAGVARDSAADQSALDSLHGRADQPPKPTTPLTPAPAPAAGRGDTTVRGEDVQREAERLFGRDEAKTILGANDNAGAVFDID